jgi:hypothetical protein
MDIHPAFRVRPGVLRFAQAGVFYGVETFIKAV